MLGLLSICLTATLAQVSVDALQGELDAAPIVVRGRALDSQVQEHTGHPLAQTFTRLDVYEVLKGSAPARIFIKQPGAGEDQTGLLPPSVDVVVFLERPDPDGAYPIAGFPLGRYRVVATPGGEALLADGTGVDNAFASPKDKRPGSEVAPLSLAVVRQMLHAPQPLPLPEKPRERLSPPPARARKLATPTLAATEPPVSTGPEPKPWWPWLIAATLALAAGLLLFLTRPRGRN